MHCTFHILIVCTHIHLHTRALSHTLTHLYQLMFGPVIVFTHIPIHTRALSYTLTLLYQLMRGPVHMAIESGESRSIRGIDPYTPKASIPSPPTSSSFTTHLAHPFIHHDIPPSIVAQ